MTPSAQYAAITTAVQDIIARHSENDTDRAAGLVARAALLAMRDRRDASAKAYALADELATAGGGK